MVLSLDALATLFYKPQFQYNMAVFEHLMPLFQFLDIKHGFKIFHAMDSKWPISVASGCRQRLNLGHACTNYPVYIDYCSEWSANEIIDAHAIYIKLWMEFNSHIIIYRIWQLSSFKWLIVRHCQPWTNNWTQSTFDHFQFWYTKAPLSS